MQYKAVLSLALFGTAFAAPTEKRQVATISAAVMQIGTSLTALDTAIKAVQGPADAPNVIQASNDVQTALTTATNMVMGVQPISLTDALTLQQTTAALSTQVSTTINDLTAKKDIIQAAGQTQTTLTALQQQRDAANGFAQAVTSKVPANVQTIAASQSGMITSALDQGIAAFGGAAGAPAAPPAAPPAA